MAVLLVNVFLAVGRVGAPDARAFLRNPVPVDGEFDLADGVRIAGVFQVVPYHGVPQPGAADIRDGVGQRVLFLGLADGLPAAQTGEKVRPGLQPVPGDVLIGFARQVLQSQGQVDGVHIIFVALPGVSLPPRRIPYQAKDTPVYALDDREGHQKAEDLRHQAVDLRGPAGAPQQMPQNGQQPLQGNQDYQDSHQEKRELGTQGKEEGDQTGGRQQLIGQPQGSMAPGGGKAALFIRCPQCFSAPEKVAGDLRGGEEDDREPEEQRV